MDRSVNMRGDTIIEVLLGITIFSMVAVGAMAVMNRGAAIAQQSLEITLTRQQVDAQAEMLRYIHDKKGPLWQELKARNLVTVDTLGAGEGNLGSGSCPDRFGSREFALAATDGGGISILRDSSTQYSLADTYARVDDANKKAYGLSIRLVAPGSGADRNKYDAYIKACWMPVNSQMPSTIGTIVRLYDGE